MHFKLYLHHLFSEDNVDLTWIFHTLMERMRGDRPKRSKSPISRKNQRKNVPARRPDPGTEDFIRFVRDFQVNRQPTFTGIQRRAPLPEIGQPLNNVGLNDSGFLDRLNDEYDDSGLEDEILYSNKVSVPRNDRIVKEVLTITRQQTRDNLYSTCKSKINNDSFILSRQKSNLQRTWSLPQSKQQKCARSMKNRQSLKQLPPLFNDEFPARPTAPSPSMTPPLDYSDGSEDQVEFLDLS